MTLFTLALASLLTLADGTGVTCERDAMPKAPCSLMAQRTAVELQIDGRLDEPEWADAAVATGFRQFEPVEGAEPSQRTEVRILYGETALYVGAYLYDDAPEKIMRTLGRRDDLNQADWFMVAIDSYLDRKTAYAFSVNAGGVQHDGIITRDLDASWDAVWTADVALTDEGWVAEMRIPYAMLRFAEADVQTWGINFRRTIPRLSETNEWALVRRTERAGGLVARFGQLEGLRGIRPRRNVQVSPYSVSSLRTAESELEPGRTDVSGEIDAGADLKLGLTSNITLDATFNPDFGQVESDPASLNLSAFETVFEERRPFFQEGVQIFDFSYGREGGLLYTRRIGGRAPIIAASKLSGRTGRGLSFGLLGAATGERFSPTRFYGVARVKQQIGLHSTAGAILTGFDRTLDEEARSSLAGGADWDLRFANNTYGLNGHLSFTHIVVPDAETSPGTGFAGALSFERLQGVWAYELGGSVFDDRFDTNDVGRLRRNNNIRLNAGFRHELNGGEPFGLFRRGSARLFTWQNWSYREGLSQGSGFFLRSDMQTRGFQEVELNLFTDYLIGGYDLYETRGLFPWAPPRSLRLSTNFETDSRRNWRLEPGLTYGLDAAGGRRFEIDLRGEWNAGSRLDLSAGIELGGEQNQASWAANESFLPGADGWRIGEESTTEPEAYRLFNDGELLTGLLAGLTPEDDGRYLVPIFGERDTRSAEFSLRGNVTFTPRLSLQLFSQLFIARGRYDRFSLLLDRDTSAPFDAYPKRHDFAFQSFITNAVLRWEFRPGSALYVVWSQARDGDAALDPFDLGASSPYETSGIDQFGDTFGLFPANVFLVKLNYLFLR